MSNYLEKFRGTIRTRQANQILELLSKKKRSGQIQTIDEFTRKLNSLLQELTGVILQPTLKLFYAEAREKISSEQFNEMLDRTNDDLIAAYEEANNIDEVQRSHEALIRDVTLKNLRAGVAELESKISLYEYLSKEPGGFDTAIFSTFREAREGRAQRGGVKKIITLFMDPREDDLTGVEEDAYIDLIGERLLSAEDDKTFHTVHGIRQIFDATFPQSDKIVVPPGMKLTNLIDNQSGTYWIQSLLFPSRPSYAKVKLELDFGTIKEVNFLEIEPVPKGEGVYLEAIHYTNNTGAVVLLGNPEILVENPKGILIPKIATNKVILTFRNEHIISEFFEYYAVSGSLEQKAETMADNLSTSLLYVPPKDSSSKDSTLQMATIASEMAEVVPSLEVRKIIGTQPATASVNSTLAELDSSSAITVKPPAPSGSATYLSQFDSAIQDRGRDPGLRSGLQSAETTGIFDSARTDRGLVSAQSGQGTEAQASVEEVVSKALIDGIPETIPGEEGTVAAGVLVYETTSLATVPVGLDQEIADGGAGLSQASIKAGSISNVPLVYNGYKASTGFDNIRAGLASYKDRSLYASLPLEVEDLGQLGIKVAEARPYLAANGVTYYTSTTYDTDDDKYFMASIEYWVVKQDYNKEETLIRTQVLPILPIRVNRVHHERLVLTEKSDSSLPNYNMGSLIHYASEVTSDIKVYRNGGLLETHMWSSDQTTTVDKTPAQNSPMQFKIRVIDQLLGDIYTVSYSPLFSTTKNIPTPPYSQFTTLTGIGIVDLVGDLSTRFCKDNIIIVDNPKGLPIAKTKAHLIIIFRQNSANTNLTAAVEEYMLFGSKRDSKRFEED